MFRIIVAIVIAVAFAYALWLVLTGRALPPREDATGVRRRFRLAALLFAGLFAGTTDGCRTQCYEPLATRAREPQGLQGQGNMIAVKQAELLAAARQKGTIDAETAARAQAALAHEGKTLGQTERL